MNKTYKISGMHCGGCVSKVKLALSSHAANVEVALEPPTVYLSEPHSTLKELNQALASVGDYTLSTPALSIKASPTAHAAPQPHAQAPETPSWIATYQPLLLIIGYILLVSLLIEAQADAFELHRWMPHFMAGFFLVFSFFKLLNLKAFASSYAMYDIVAMRWKAYGLIYPFIELGLGVAYLLNYQPWLTNLATLIVMGVSSIGVIIAVRNKRKIRCACLGAVFNLPMSTITIIEDLLMAAMALWMLV